MSNVYETTEAPSNTSTTYSIGINDQFRGTINSAYESDWVRIDLTGGTGYYFRMTGDGGPDSLAESELDLHNSDGVVYSSGPEGTVSLISASPRADGTFYLSASPGDVSYNTSALGDYVITPYAEIGNNLATTTTLAPGSSTTTAIDYAGDEDYFRVDVEAGSSYYIEMTGTSSGLVNRSRLELYGSEENYIGANDGQTARIVYTPETDETIFVAADPNHSYRGGYRISAESEISNTFATPEVIEIDGSVSSAIDYGGDLDRFGTSLEAGYSYIVRMTGDVGTDSLGSHRVFLSDETGTEVARSGNYDAYVATLTHTPGTDGDFFITADPSSSSADGAYRLSLQQEISGGTGTATSVAVGGSLESTLDYDTDEDMIAVQLEAGTLYGLSLEAAATGDPIERSAFAVLSANGTVLRSDTAEEPALAFEFAPEETGTYYLRVGTDSYFGRSGDYAVSVDVMGGTGTEGSDVLTGTANADTIEGRGGDDRIEGGDGNDYLMGGDGDDGLLGGSGNDTLDGGAGDDNIAASVGNDEVWGGLGNDFIGGGTGDDVLNGEAGQDTLGGGGGADSISAGTGDDVVAGGAGNDTIAGGDGGDTMGGSYADDSITGGEGDDSLGGGTGRDVIAGGAGDDAIGGGEGDDVVDGGLGNDFLAGGGRNDTIEGGSGDDRINGGGGDDVLSGGSGADVFIWNGGDAGAVDIVEDFTVGIDTLRLSGVANASGTGLEGKVDTLDIYDVTLESGLDAAVLNYDGQFIALAGVSSIDLTVADFVFI